MVATKLAPTLGPVSNGAFPKLWTRAEYARMSNARIIGPDDHIELIEGIIYQMAAQKSRGAVAICLIREAVANAFGPGVRVRVQLPLALSDRSEPEPDIAAVLGSARDYLLEHPSTALLVVEVSDTTLRFDRRTKARLYARADIPDYWIANVVTNQLEVHRDPSPTGYRTVTILKPGDSIAPLARPDTPIAVADLLP